LEGPLGLRITAENPEAIDGGLDRSGPAPSRSDYQLLKAKLLDRLENNALDEIRAQVPSGQRLLEGTLVANAIVEETVEPAIHQPGDQLSLTLRVEYEAWTVAEADLNAVAQAALDANLKKGQVAVPDTVQVTFLEAAPRAQPELAQEVTDTPVAEKSLSDTDEIVRWPVQIERQVESSWSEESTVRAVLGKPVDEATQILSTTLSLAEKPRIAVFPVWWPRLPFLPFRVEVVQP